MIYRFSVDDTIWVLRDLTRGGFPSIFDHKYLAFYRELHGKYGLKVQFNLFYETDGFNLSQMTDRYAEEFKQNADWMQFSFHSKSGVPNPYKYSAYDEVRMDCERVNTEILRFAGAASLNPFTTLHCCACTQDGGVRALSDCGVKGLVGLFGTVDNLRISYDLPEAVCRYLQTHSFYRDEDFNMWYIKNDVVINLVASEDICPVLEKKIGQDFIEIMIHEQFFFEEYARYGGNAEGKVESAVAFLAANGYRSVFLNEILTED